MPKYAYSLTGFVEASSRDEAVENLADELDTALKTGATLTIGSLPVDGDEDEELGADPAKW